MSKELSIKDILGRFPFRFSITNQCNLDCFFCSHEGLDELQNRSILNLADFDYLTEVLCKHGSKGIVITGGEPMVHPQIEDILRIAISRDFKTRFFHTNAVALKEDIVKKYMHHFTKIGISLHTPYAKVWSKITSRDNKIYDRILENLDMIGKYRKNNTGMVIEMRYVALKGINDDPESIIKFLDICKKYDFSYKFYVLESAKPEQDSLKITRNRLEQILESIGLVNEGRPVFRGQSDYCPLTVFNYQGQKGVVAELGCGKPGICKNCYNANQIDITPNLEIMPCNFTNVKFPLKEAIDNRDEQAILEQIIESREYLKTAPGANHKYWNNSPNEKIDHSCNS